MYWIRRHEKAESSFCPAQVQILKSLLAISYVRIAYTLVAACSTSYVAFVLFACDIGIQCDVSYVYPLLACYDVNHFHSSQVPNRYPIVFDISICVIYVQSKIREWHELN